MKLTKEPAVLFGLVAAVVAAVSEALQAANEGGSFNVWTLVIVGVPLLAGILTRAAVVPVEAVRDAITNTRSASAAVNDLADRIDVAVQDRPAGA